MSRVAVIGAGLAGLVAARELAGRHEVTVFEKARGPAGRMATRYAGRFEFDHGAQFFTARSARFRRYLKPYVATGAVRTWRARFAEVTRDGVSASRDWTDDYPHYVGAPRMNSFCKALADGLRLRLETRVAPLAGDWPPWQLRSADGSSLGTFDWVVSSAPAAQTEALLPASSPLARHASATPMQACYALMLGFNRAPALPWQAARVRDSDLSWVSVNSSKPGRDDPFTLVVHSTNAWAGRHVDDDQGRVKEHLLSSLKDAIGLDAREAAHLALHRWRYANLPRQHERPVQVDPDRQLAVCGDWLVRGRVEAAFQSSVAMLEQLGELVPVAAKSGIGRG